METPNQEKTINQMSIAELDVVIENAQQNLDGLLLEVRNNPNPASQEEASEKAISQLEALIAMKRKQGELTRLATARIKEGETEREIDLDRDSARILNQ